jgi:hypothetical protein
MAKVEAPQVTEEETPAPAPFILEGTALDAIKKKGGREAAPSLYLEEVRGQIGSDKAMGIPVTGDMRGTKVMSELRKAAKQLDVHIRIWDRSGKNVVEGTQAFVGFKVLDKPAKSVDPVEVHAEESSAA